MKLRPEERKLIDRANANFKNLSTVRAGGSLTIRAWNRKPCCRVFVSGREIKLA